MSLHQMPKLGYRAKDAAVYLGLSETKFHNMVKDGRLPKPRRIDGCVVWRADELVSAFNRLTDGEGPSNLDRKLGLA
ncbi:hypothetical protein [Maricaulis sp.]|uniref:helix-turn-helix transcriptional regulator n=1 Tax=Maricaulis sp. TaxID=1486257 RepID=UPI002621D755|nr:hypothetical protein [Maricaulis sp.]MDF1769869.1 hypothetical protein [Maricaulis sp.]